MKKKKKLFTKPVEEKKEEAIIEEVKEVKPVIVKPEKKIINAVSVVILDNGSKEAKKLIEDLNFQKTKYYPETEIVVVNEDNVDLLDLTKGQFIIYIKEYQPIKKDFLHQLYVNMRSGKESYLNCVDRKTLK